MARFKDLTFAVLDIGQDSHPCVAAWRMGAEAALARKIILGPQQEMAIMTYGSDHTNHDLINDASASQYVGINVITPFHPGQSATLARAASCIVPGRGASDCVSALIVALDLLKRKTEESKLHQARKCIVFASCFTTPTEGLDPAMLSGLAVQCTTLKVSLNIAVASWLSLSQEAQAVQRQTVAIFEQLHAAGVAGSVTYLSHPADFTGSVKAQPSFTSTACTLKVHQFEYEVKSYKVTDVMKPPTTKPYSTMSSAPGAQAEVATGAPATHDVRRDTEWFSKEDAEKEQAIMKEDRIKMHRFGKDWFPAADAEEYKRQSKTPAAVFKGIRVLAFVPREPTPDECVSMGGDADLNPHAVPRWALQAAITALLPSTDKGVVAISALVQAMHARKLIAIVQYALRANSAIHLGALVPVLGVSAPGANASTAAPDHFLLSQVPWGGDYRADVLRNEDQSHESQAMSSDLSEAHTDTMQAVVDALTDLDSTLPPVTCCDPAIARVATTLVKTGLEQQAAVASGKPIPYATFQAPLSSTDPIAQRALLPDASKVALAQAAIHRLAAADGDA